MPLIGPINSALAAAGDQAFPLRGQQYETLPYDAFVEFAITTDVAVVRISVYSGGDLLQQDADAPVLAAATPHTVPDHFVLNDVAGWNERLGVTGTKISGAASVMKTSVRISRV